MSLEFGVSLSENSEKTSEKVIGGWANSEGHRGVHRYPMGYISSVEQSQKQEQDNASLTPSSLSRSHGIIVLTVL